MSWRDYFDRIYVIHPIHSGFQRRFRIERDFLDYGIKFRFWPAIMKKDGRKGIYETFMSLFSMAIAREQKKILVFEDDVQFILQPEEFNEIMSEIVRQAKMVDWMQIKLGSVLLRPAKSLVTPNLFETFGSYGLHAAAYNTEFMSRALAIPEELPLDVSWSKRLESYGRCYQTYPLLASQYPGESFIEGKWTNWDEYIQGAFKAHTSKINLTN